MPYSWVSWRHFLEGGSFFVLTPACVKWTHKTSQYKHEHCFHLHSHIPTVNLSLLFHVVWSTGLCWMGMDPEDLRMEGLFHSGRIITAELDSWNQLTETQEAASLHQKWSWKVRKKRQRGDTRGIPNGHCCTWSAPVCGYPCVFIFRYVAYPCVSRYVCTVICVLVCVHIWRTDALSLTFGKAFSFLCLSLARNLTTRVDWPPCKPLGPCLPTVGITSVHHHAQHSHLGSGGGGQVLRFTRQMLTV